ncbi:conserved membrane hypothetical protein [Candidatus Sulfopaludibacter sp. SbA3]|nr:conserved membrane hypothetical protein [Candidatus Sulfopaludibacter sp. SbA3]
MTVLLAVLRALSRAIRRDLGTFGSLTVNNFSLFVALMIYGCAVSGVEPKSSYPFLLLLGFLLLFPLSSDPLAKIPPQRLALWPLSARQRFLLRAVSLLLSPVVWFTLFLLFKTAPPLALFFLALAVGVLALLAFSRRVMPAVPPVPPLPGLVRKNLRQMLSVLDPYLALVVSMGGAIYRFATPKPDPMALPILAILVGLALSTYAQCLFSLDSASGITRYGLIPLRGWQILLAKDAAFLGVLFLLILPLDAVAGATFGLTALASGHWPSVSSRLPLRRWRFAGGRLKFGVAQVLVGTVLAMGGPVCLGIALAGYLYSLYLCGKRVPFYGR